MAKIIYGVAGEGFGHSTRSHVIAGRLMAAGHEVMLLGSGKSLKYLREVFGERVEEVFGLKFAYRKTGQVSAPGTIRLNVTRYAKERKVNVRLFGEKAAAFGPDVVISDFEPFCAWWARRNNVPLVSVDNEHLLTHCRFERDANSPWARIKAETVTRAYYWGASAYVVLSFFRAEPKRENVHVAVPVVRREVEEAKVSGGEHVVVYSTTGNRPEELAAVLGNFAGREFRVYGFEGGERIGNCVLRPYSNEGFLADVASSAGVIASAGFSLLSECMYLGKKMLVVPVGGQYEQMVNAEWIERLGLGVASERLDCEAVERFLMEAERPMPQDDRILWPDNEGFFRRLEECLRSVGL